MPTGSTTGQHRRLWILLLTLAPVLLLVPLLMLALVLVLVLLLLRFRSTVIAAPIETSSTKPLTHPVAQAVRGVLLREAARAAGPGDYGAEGQDRLRHDGDGALQWRGADRA